MKITFHMKSGDRIEVVADRIETKNANGNELVAYTLEGMKRKADLHYLRMDDVSAITTKE